MTGNVLENLQRKVQARKGSTIQGDVMDKTGTGKRIGFRAILQLNPEERKKFVLTGFSYLPDEPHTIGVMKKIARIGDGESRWVLVYFDDRELHQALVFNPMAFIEHGESGAKNENRQRRNERWWNLPRGYACTLRELADGQATPSASRKEASGQQRLNAGEWGDE